MYGLTTAPLTATDLEKLSAAQRKMLRLMVGYTKFAEDSWEDMYRRLKGKITHAMTAHNIFDWGGELIKRKSEFLKQLIEGRRSGLVHAVHMWSPKLAADPKLLKTLARSRGRPRTRWSQYVTPDW